MKSEDYSLFFHSSFFIFHIKPMLTKHLSFLLASFAISFSTAFASISNRTDSVYLFTYHHGPATDGIKVAYSFDQKHWIPISNYSFVKSDYGNWGANKKMYSPSLVFYQGRWYAIWAVNPDVNQFATTCSSDFWTWKPQDYPYMKEGENVQNPILSKQSGEFVVSYSTNKNQYYETRSKDFKHWSAPMPISATAYSQKQKAVKQFINGTEVVGELHRIPSVLIKELEMRVNDATLRNQAYDESTRDDARRFEQVKALKAMLNVDLNDTKSISTNLIGIFFEDINYSADGGLYAELIQNRDFEYS